MPVAAASLFLASWVILAWFIYWLSVIAARWLFSNQPTAAGARTEVAAFAAMIGVAMLVTYLFPERHFWHGEVSRDAAYSPIVFASVLICEVALYIAWKILNPRPVSSLSAVPVADAEAGGVKMEHQTIERVQPPSALHLADPGEKIAPSKPSVLDAPPDTFS